MTLKLNGYINGKHEPDLEKVILLNKDFCKGVSIIHPEGTNFVFVAEHYKDSTEFPPRCFQQFQLYFIPEGKTPEEFNLKNKWPMITGRSIDDYKRDFNKKSIDLERLIEEGKDKLWILPGAGVDELTPYLAEEKEKIKSKSQVVIIDPLDYKLLYKSLLSLRQYIKDKDLETISLSNFGPSKEIDTALNRIKIILNSQKIKNLQIKLSGTQTKDIEELFGSAYAVVDYKGAFQYSDDKDNIKKVLSKFLQKNYKENLLILSDQDF